jgi:hypothetical protein
MPPSRTCWPNAPRWSPGSRRTGRASSTLRELPPLRAVLQDLSGLGLLVVDGYADLDPAGRPDLGAHAHAEFGIPVIGVAKSRFRTATHALPVLRGSSARPLFVTSAGMPAADAADLVRHMAGRYRLPDALRRADTLARTGPPAATMTDRQPDRPTQTRGTRHESRPMVLKDRAITTSC